MMVKRTLLLLVTAFLLLPFSLSAQNHAYTIMGRVTNADNKQALAFVNIITEDGKTGTTSDIDGKYSIGIDKATETLIFSCVGFEKKTVTVEAGQKKLNVALQPTQYSLDEVVINPGENPAHRLIDSLVAHRKDNYIENLDSYSYTLYDKMVFTVDSSGHHTDSLRADTATTRSKMFGILKKNDLMITETVSEQKFLAPDRHSQKVIGNKVSGMKEPMFIYLVSEIQSISFYDEDITIVGTKYLNPISKKSYKKYLFRIESAELSPTGDSVFVVSFRRRDDTNFDGLKGLMTINSDGWAVQNVKASPDSKEEGFFTANIQQLYEKVDGQWFPKQLNTNILFPSFAVDLDGELFPLAAIGKSYITEIKVNPELDRREFSEIEVDVDKKAAKQDEAFWDSYRNDSLTQRVKDTYQFMDSISENVINLDRTFKTLSIIANDGAYPLGPINIELLRIINYSKRNGWYFGLGLSTNDRMLKWMKLSGFFGYYLKAKFFQYSGTIDFTLSQKKQTHLSFTFHNRQVATSSFDRFSESEFALDPMYYRYEFFEPYPAFEMAGRVNVSSRLFGGLKGFASFTYGERSYFYNLDSTAYNIIGDTSSFLKHRHAEIELKLRFAYKEKFASTPYGLQSLGTQWPIIWVGYTHSFANVWGSHYSFDRIMFQAHKYFRTKRVGVSFVMLQAGMTFGDIPIGEMLVPLGTHLVFGLYSPGSFSTMRGNEFFCDRYVGLFWAHNFGSTLWHIKSSWFRPEPVIATNIGWGCVKDENKTGLPTIDKGYFESGLMINGLVTVSMMKLGFGAFYRYGPYSFDKTWDNFSLKWNVIFTL